MAYFRSAQTVYSDGKQYGNLPSFQLGSHFANDEDQLVFADHNLIEQVSDVANIDRVNTDFFGFFAVGIRLFFALH